MGKALAIGEALIVLKEFWDSASAFFTESVPKDFLGIMDKMTFLTSEFLAVGSNGEILDKTKKIGEAIMNLSNLVIWGILIFYAFVSIFSYFLSKRVEVPWKFFIRMIVFGVFANASFFICYTGIFFAENCTDYIRSYVGEDKVSFDFLEDYIDLKLDTGEEGADIYTLDFLISVFTYFSTFFVAVCLGGRYILIKVLMLFSPVFFLLGGLKCSEKIFFRWCRSFFTLLFMQVVFCGILGVFSLTGTNNSTFLRILVCSVLFILAKNILSFLNLSY